MHRIDMSNGRANMAYVGERPWHGLGAELEPGADLDQWRIAAGLNWSAEMQDLYFRSKQDHLVHPATSKIIYRSDTAAELGIATDRYKIAQPGEVLEFFRDLTQGNSTETRFKSAQFGQGAQLKRAAWAAGLALAA